jgi:hypothetical protein
MVFSSNAVETEEEVSMEAVVVVARAGAQAVAVAVVMEQAVAVAVVMEAVMTGEMREHIPYIGDIQY